MPHKDPEKRKAYKKKYREENKEKIVVRNKKYYKKNRERELAKFKKYHEENKEKILVRHKKYREENPEYDKKYREEKSQTQASVVYMIECKATNKYYIGQTSQWCGTRIIAHKSQFNKNRNPCGAGIMQDDYNEYGPDAFEYSILKELDPQASEEERLREEKNYINEFLKEGKQLYNKFI